MRHLFAASLLVCAASASGWAAVDQGLLDLVPPGAKIITSVDINQAKNSPFGQYLLSKINTQDHNFGDLIQQTGFDPRRDLQGFVFASPGPDNNTAQSRFALIVRGNFDQDRIREMAQTKGASIQNYRGYDIFVSKSDHQHPAFTFTEAQILVMGDIATIQQVVANRAIHAGFDPQLEQMVSTVSVGNDAWFASVMPGSYLADHVKQEASQPAAAQALQGVLQSSGGIQFGSVIRLSFDATARSPKDAQSIVDVIRFLGTMVQMNRQKSPNAENLASAVDAMTLDTNGDAVHISISLPEQALEQLANVGMHGGPFVTGGPHPAVR